MAVPILERKAVRALAVPLDVEAYRELGNRGRISQRTELLAGVVVEKMWKNPLHAAVVRRLFAVLADTLQGRFFVTKEDPITIAEVNSEPEPDIAIVDIAPGGYLDRHPTTAHLVVEVADTSVAVDREMARLYAAARTPEYWLIDLGARTTTIYTEPTADGYRRTRTVAADETLAPQCAPELGVRLADLLTTEGS